MNVHAEWRLAVARKAAAAYTRNPKLAALTVAGSVGAGLADQFSDLELDCYWSAAPSARDRTGPIEALDGSLTALWDYDADEGEWSEDFRLDGLDVTVSNFLTVTVDRFLDEVTGEADPPAHRTPRPVLRPEDRGRFPGGRGPAGRHRGPGCGPHRSRPGVLPPSTLSTTPAPGPAR